MKSFFRSLFQLFSFSAFQRFPSPPALPFVPFHPVSLSDEQIRHALSGRLDDFAVRAVMQMISGEMWEAVNAMAAGQDRARGEFAALQALYSQLDRLVRAPFHAEKEGA